MTTKRHSLTPIIALLLILAAGTLTAQDWITWQKHENNPLVEGDAEAWFRYMFDPCVLYENDTYRMWFTGFRQNGLREIGYGESADGLSWEINDEPLIEAGDLGAWDRNKFFSTVLRVNDTLRAWYWGFHALTYQGIQIGYAWSLDGLAWNFLESPVMTTGEEGSWDELEVLEPNVVHHEGTYHMWYASMGKIGHATSADGVHWQKDESNPVIGPGEPGTYTCNGVFAGPVIIRNDTAHMFFSGTDNFGKDCTGHASSTDLASWDIHPEMILSGDPGGWDDACVMFSTILCIDGQYRAYYIGAQYTNGKYFSLGVSTAFITGVPEQGSTSVGYFAARPNPFDDRVRLTFELKRTSDVMLILYNSLGQKIDTYRSGEMQTGQHSTTLDASGSAPGIYYCTLKTDQGTTVIKLLKN